MIAGPGISWLPKPRYMTASVSPVVFVTTGSFASFGMRYLTWFTLAMTSVMALFGS